MTLEMSVALRCVLRIAYCVLSLAMRIVSCVQRAFTSNSVCVVSARSFLMTFLPAGIFRYNVCRRSTLFEALAFLSHDGHPINSGSFSHGLRELRLPHPASYTHERSDDARIKVHWHAVCKKIQIKLISTELS
jgi:hypothetical protein